MSLFGSLYAGVSGLSAQSQAIGAIANNISNVNTTGYKRIDMSFGSLVTTEVSSGRYSPGSVRGIKANTTTLQGAIQQTANPTDISITGNGMFVVQRTPEALSEKLYTRSGSFQEDSNGFLRNSTGFYLMGWPIDGSGQLPAGQADPSSLVPVDVAFLGGLTKQTTKANISINLDANQVPETYPVPDGQAAHFSRGLRIFDSLGQSQDIEFRFTKHASPTASARTAIGGGGLDINQNLTDIANIDVGDELIVTVGAASDTFVVDTMSTVQDFVAFINESLDLQGLATAVIDDSSQLRITAANLDDNVVVSNGTVVGGVGASTAMGFTTVPAPIVPNVFPAGADQLKTIPNTDGWWKLDLIAARTGAVLSSGSINFTRSGEMNAVYDLDNERKISIDNIFWGNGSEPQDIDIDIGAIGQFAGAYNVIFTNQNGAELGLRTGVEINREGVVSARFSNGQLAPLYKIPLATFTNANGLEEVTGNAYVAGSESGSFNLREAGRGGSGLINGATVEASNVDLAEEFSKMITIQRAYSANTKVISAADEMTEELLRLR